MRYSKDPLDKQDPKTRRRAPRERLWTPIGRDLPYEMRLGSRIQQSLAAAGHPTEAIPMPGAPGKPVATAESPETTRFIDTPRSQWVACALFPPRSPLEMRTLLGVVVLATTVWMSAPCAAQVGGVPPEILSRQAGAEPRNRRRPLPPPSTTWPIASPRGTWAPSSRAGTA